MFDIANELRLDTDVTVKALKELWEKGRVKLDWLVGSYQYKQYTINSHYGI